MTDIEKVARREKLENDAIARQAAKVIDSTNKILEALKTI